MPATHFPNGISAQTASATNTNLSAGQLDATKYYGETASIQYTFGSASAAESVYVPAPFNGNIINAQVVVVTSARVAAYTVRQGSAGTVSVASQSNTTGVAGSKSSLTIASAAVTTASGLLFTRGAQGSTGVTTLSLTIQRTA